MRIADVGRMSVEDVWRMCGAWGGLGLEGTFVRDHARVVHPVLDDSPLLIACILHVTMQSQLDELLK